MRPVHIPVVPALAIGIVVGWSPKTAKKYALFELVEGRQIFG